MFLGPLKALRRDPPVIYLALRPWQNFVGIEVGLLLAAFLLLVGFSGWPGGHLALFGLPLGLVLVVVGLYRLAFRHRIRIDSRCVYREQFTPGTRLTEEWSAADVLSVHVLPVPGRSWWGGSRWLTGVALTFRNGDLWQLTAGDRPWQERHLARSVATIVGATFCDRTIVGVAPLLPRDVRVVVGDGAAADILPPADPGLVVLDTVPRRMVLQGRPGGLRRWRRREELEVGMGRLTIRRRGWGAGRPLDIPWASITVLGRDAVHGGLLIAQRDRETVVGAGLSSAAVDWLVGRLRSYVP